MIFLAGQLHPVVLGQMVNTDFEADSWEYDCVCKNRKRFRYILPQYKSLKRSKIFQYLM